MAVTKTRGREGQQMILLDITHFYANYFLDLVEGWDRKTLGRTRAMLRKTHTILWQGPLLSWNNTLFYAKHWNTNVVFFVILYLTSNLPLVTLTSYSRPKKIHHLLFNGQSQSVYVKMARNVYVTLKLPFTYLPVFSLKWQHTCMCHIV